MNRAIKFLQGVWEDYLCWQGQDRKTLKRINLLITEAARDPLKGTGQLQPLVGNLSGYWSRRMDQIHRLVYRVDDHHVLVLQCPYHYGAKTLMKTGAGCGLVLKFWSVSFRPKAARGDATHRRRLQCWELSTGASKVSKGLAPQNTCMQLASNQSAQ